MSDEALRVVRGSARDLARLEPVWKALQAHHARITPELGHSSARSPEESWRRRVRKYASWIEEPDTFVLLAERGELLVGYAFVTVGPGLASWATGDRVAALETLSVIPEARGSGVGTALLDAVDERLAELGVHELMLTAANANADAHRFYERRRLAPVFRVFYGRAGESPPS